MKNKITFILLSLFLLNPTLGYSYQGEVFTSSSLTPIETKSAKAIWKIIIPPAGGGTGFFISKNEFVTNFHVAIDLTQKNIKNSYLTQEGNLLTLKIKQINRLSVQYDLAVLEIEGEVNDYLNISKETPQPNEDLFSIGYPLNTFTVTNKTSDMLYYDKSNHSFFSDYSIFFGASGSPWLNSKGEVVGVFHSAGLNLVRATKAINLKSLLNEEIKSFETPEGHIAYAIEQLTKAANQGRAEAQYRLGLSYARGHGVEPDIKEAFNWIKKAANQGLATAQFYLGLVYDKISGVEQQDYNQAFNWYQEAAEQGDAAAQYNLGLLYYHGQGVEKDPKEAFNWIKKAASQGLVDAQYHVGLSYYHEQGVEQNLNQAFNWTEKAAKQGHANAQYHLGLFYYYEIGVEKDYNKAFNWYQKAANQGLATAQFNLGFAYYDGEGVEKDLNQALNWFRKAAEQGDAGAIDQLKKM